MPLFFIIIPQNQGLMKRVYAHEKRDSEYSPPTLKLWRVNENSPPSLGVAMAGKRVK